MANATCEAAKAYVARGWSVLPIRPKSKLPHPLVERLELGLYEYEARFADAEEIDGWFAQDPNANIAVMCGPISGLLILAVDKADEMPELMNLLAQVVGEIPTVKTDRGFHYYFAYPDGEEISQSNKPYPWMDVHGVGNYALLPPSIHPSGANYEWLVSLLPGMPLPMVPPALLDLLKESLHKFTTDGSRDYPSDFDEDDEDWDDEDDDFEDGDDEVDEEASTAEGEALAATLLDKVWTNSLTVTAFLSECMQAAETELCYESTDIDDWKLLGMVRKALAISKLWQAKPLASLDELKAATLDVKPPADAVA